jgi:hypothetical protein
VADRDQITASLSSFTTRAMSNGGSVTEPGSAGNVGDAKLGPNFSLMPGSPAIDSGDPTLTGLDLIGRPRSRDGDSDGVAAPDMGAFEAAPPGAGDANSTRRPARSQSSSAHANTPAATAHAFAPPTTREPVPHRDG